MPPAPFAAPRAWLPAGLLALLLLAGCRKEPSPLDQLPGATQQGLNTAGWLLEGKAWVPTRSSISTGTPVNGYRQKRAFLNKEGKSSDSAAKQPAGC